MRIAQVAPLYEPVPPPRYRGTERVVGALAAELVARGHEVTVFGSGDSATPARLVASCPRALHAEPTPWDYSVYAAMQLGEVPRRGDRFDVVHFSVGRMTDRDEWLYRRLLVGDRGPAAGARRALAHAGA